MTGDPLSDQDTDASTDVDAVEVAIAASSTYKVLGEFSDPRGTGILGKNTANSGTPIGVEGTVPNASAGYGLSTPDDARINGTLDTDETDFVVEAGTTDTIDATNVVMGHATNTATSGTVGATIGGGGRHDGTYEDSHHISADYATVAGGRDNTGGGDGATVAGGEYNIAGGGDASVGGGKTNTASGEVATIGGGRENIADDYGTTVAGGGFNTAGSTYATVGGGNNNTATSGYTATVSGGYKSTATGNFATVPGGRRNDADGAYSLAAGRQANAAHDGAFVFGDSSSTAISSGGPDEVRSQMPIYAPSHNSTSARSQKTRIESVDPPDVLAGVRSLSVSTWEFVDTDDGRHMGPMAGEFTETFELGGDDETIASVDADGVALAAIQGLADQLDEVREELADKDDRISEQADRIDDLEAENEQLCERLSALEAQVGIANPPADD